MSVPKTIQEVVAHNARVAAGKLSKLSGAAGGNKAESKPVDCLNLAAPEREIHEQIAAELVLRRWYFVHSQFGKPTTQNAGVPDFIIAAPEGITLWVEVKKKGGKLSEEQNVTRHVLLALDHYFLVVYSLDDFLSFELTAFRFGMVEKIGAKEFSVAVNPCVREATRPG